MRWKYLRYVQHINTKTLLHYVLPYSTGIAWDSTLGPSCVHELPRSRHRHRPLLLLHRGCCCCVTTRIRTNYRRCRKSDATAFHPGSTRYFRLLLIDCWCIIRVHGWCALHVTVSYSRTDGLHRFGKRNLSTIEAKQRKQRKPKDKVHETRNRT